MYSRIDDRIYKTILQRIENGTYVKGNNCKLNTRYLEGRHISEFRMQDRTPELCASLMDYGDCKFYDVPIKSRTREFFITQFTDKDVFNYIKENIHLFDRQFFKDVIESNRYSTHFNDKNIFEIMPLEYIDEEMCALAAVKSTDWSCDGWVRSILKRKPQVLTEELWQFIIRFYGEKRGEKNYFLSVAPEEVKTEEFYKQMCRCNFNVGARLYSKGKVMEDVPQEFITQEFLFSLLFEDEEYIAMYSEEALEKEVYHSHCDEGHEPFWKFVVRFYGHVAKYLPLNDERCEYFLSLYPKDSNQYKYGFKRVYKEYKKQKENKQAYEETQQRIKNNAEDAAFRMLFGAMLYSNEGKDPSQAIEDETIRQRQNNINQLPINYYGEIPFEYRKEYDSEEYLEMIYKSLGIKIIEEYDYLFYSVQLPSNLTITCSDGYNYKLIDENGNVLLTYYYQSKFYDRSAYVGNVYFDPKDIIKLTKK